MYPLLNSQDELELNYFNYPVPIEELNRGDIVLLRDQEEWILHRVVKGAQSKGDWNNQVDGSLKAWARLQRINGLSADFMESNYLSFLSEQVHQKNKTPIRRSFRLLLWLSAKILRYYKMRRL